MGATLYACGADCPGHGSSMKKQYVLVVLAILLVGATAAGSAWYWHRSHDYLAIAREAMARGELHRAQIALRAMVRDRPESAEAHFRLGAVQLQLGDAVAAEKELRLAQAGGWNQRQVLPLLARAYFAQGRFRDVLKDFSAEGLAAEEAGSLRVIQALAHLGLKELQEAQDAAAEAERLAPQNPGAPLAAARIALARNDPAAAGQKIDRALQIDPRSVEALVLKGEVQNAAGQHEAAVASFTAALAIVPDAANIRLERANTLIFMNQDKKAREDVDAVLKADARNPLGNYFQAVLLVRGGDWRGADAALQNISPIISRFPRGEYFLALVKVNLDQNEQAAEAAARYLAREPQDIAGIKLLARIHARAGRPAQMIAVLTKAADAGLADAELLELLGSAYIQTGQGALAVQTLDRAAVLAANDSVALAQIAAIRLGIGDAGGAERDLTRSLELAPDRAGIGERLVMAALAAGDVDRAGAELDRLRQLPGAEPAKLGNLLGLVRMAQLDLDGAQAAFEAALAAGPDFAAARLNLARVLALQGRTADAEKLLRVQLDREPANVAALSEISTLLLAQKQPDRLAVLIEAARRAAPGNVGITLAMADLLAGTGETRRAYALLDAVPKEQAALPGVLAARARLQESLGLDGEAQASYRQELAANPADIQTRRRLADLLVRGKNADEAKAVLRKGLEASPGNPSLLQALVGVDLRTAGLDAALATAAVLAREEANLPAARGLKGGLYMSEKRYADAAAAYQAELKASPSVPLAVAAAVALDSAGRPAEAQQLLQDWVRREPKDINLLRALSSLDLQNRRTAEAERGLLAVLAVQPNDPVALNNLAWIYQTRNDKRARAMAQKAYLLAPGAQSADTLGWIVTQQGDARTGLLLLTQAARSLATDPVIFYHLAVALNRTGQNDQAVDLLTRLVNAPGEFEDKPAARKLLQELGGPKPSPSPSSSPP
jgi:putative PEP-CTERM system TPR-repeat lipoprotein